MKPCPHCSAHKPLHEFYRDRGRKDGRDGVCKLCRLGILRRYSQSDKGRQTRKNWRQTPQGKADTTRHNHRPSTHEAKRRWWEKHGPAVVARYTSTEKSRERVRRYQRSDKGRATMARLSALRRAATQIEASLSADQWNQILTACGHRCVYCGNSHVKLEQDHVIPIVRGGQHTMQNVVPACRSCNARKNSRLLR